MPLSQASSYLSAERHQIFTPDENLIDSSTHNINDFAGIIGFSRGGTLQNISIGKVVINGELFAEDIKINRKHEDGLVLCMSNRKSNFIAKRFGKLACVRIIDVYHLKSILDEQIGVVSLIGSCAYTKSHLRDHFLKSDLDSWQDEFRLFWPGVMARNVTMPKGLALPERVRCRDADLLPVD